MILPTIRQYVFRNGARKRIPVSGVFELTPRCNLDCKMCYIHMTPEEQRPRGRELTAEEWLAIGRQAVNAGMIYLLLTGGEPMLRPDFTTIYTEMVKMGVRVTVNTNGTLVTPAIAACMAEHPPEIVNVTIYGASAATYGELCGLAAGYERAREGIRLLREAGVRVSLNSTFTHCNQADMEALVAYAREQGLPIRTAAFTFPPIRNGHPVCDVCLSPEEHGRLNARFEWLTASPVQRVRRAELLHRCLEADEARTASGTPMILPERGHPVSCMAGRGQFWMTWNGHMHPCGLLSDCVATPPAGQRIGHFAAMWAEIRESTEGIFLPPDCAVCPFERVCPGCAAVSRSRNGGASVVSKELCRYFRTYARAFVELADTEGDAAAASRRASSTDDGGEHQPFACV